MVADGHFTQKIRNYLRQWISWWVQASESWDHKTLLTWFLQSCWDDSPAKNYAAGLLILLSKEDMQITKKMGFLPDPV